MVMMALMHMPVTSTMAVVMRAWGVVSTVGMVSFTE